MGHCYGRAPSGRTVLACDGCASLNQVRKRKCPYKVQSAGPRGLHGALPWCPAPALCPSCYRDHGGLRGLHGDACREGAAAAQAEAEAEQAHFDAGDAKVVSAAGSWHADVPEGMVQLSFSNGEKLIVRKEDYDHGGWLSQYRELAQHV